VERRACLPLHISSREFTVPTKKKSCELVQQGIAGPAPDQILDAIRAEYWLPAGTPAPREPTEDAGQPLQPNSSKTKVK
jgi:hypothetical protein